tara:strand:- start:326 stop:928 length:603 start_codon:yes stop_codon:yes gene_type:complete
MEPIILETMNDIINRVDAREWRRVNEWGQRSVKRYKREKAKNESMKDDWQVATEKIAQENSELHNEIKRLKRENMNIKKENEKLKEEQFDNIEKLAKQENMCLVDIEIFDKLIEEEEENKRLKNEMKLLKSVNEQHLQRLEIMEKSKSGIYRKKLEDEIKELKEKLELFEKIREQDKYSIKRLEKLNLENKCSRCAPWRG